MTENKPRRGGRRPGAGAPKGNLNALKHGGRSRQFAQLGSLLASNPKVREALVGLGQRHARKQRRAEEVAADLFAKLLAHAHEIAAGRPSPGPFAALAALNAARKALNDAQPGTEAGRRRKLDTRNGAPRKSHRPTINRQTQTRPHDQPPDTKNAPKAAD